MQILKFVVASVATLCLLACGGGGDGSGFALPPVGSAQIAPPIAPDGPASIPDVPPPDPEATPAVPATLITPTDSTTPTVENPPPAPGQINITQLELAQTHVVPEGGLNWSLPDAKAQENLHAIGGREALALVKLSAIDARNPRLEASLHGVQLGSLPLSDRLPPTEAAGPAFATDRYSARLPAEWMVADVQLRVRADNYDAGGARSPNVGPVMPLTVRTLPFFLFGATEANTLPLREVAEPSTEVARELFAKLPASTLTVANHSARSVSWPALVIPPFAASDDASAVAYVARSHADLPKDANGNTYAMSVNKAMQALLSQFVVANGEAPGPYKYYGSLIIRVSEGGIGPGGGWGGGNAAAGNARYAGTFIHELGHTLGLPHADEAYVAGTYPYVGGSLAGSQWGYDALRGEFLAPFVPTSASRYVKCRTNVFNRQFDAQQRCVKQDHMGDGDGDQASGYRFGMFSDYNVAVMQRRLEGTTSIDGKGVRQYADGSIHEDAAFPGGYKRWDTLGRRWMAFDPRAQAIADHGLNGLHSNLPLQRNVPVHAIALTYSLAATPQVSQFYPPVSFTGNLLQTIDPTDAAQRATLEPSKGIYRAYCGFGGCDYTLRVEYVDGSVRHLLLKGGFRKGFSPGGALKDGADDPKSQDSFQSWVVHVPGDLAIRKLELLDTPKAWEGMPTSAVVRMTRNFP